MVWHFFIQLITVVKKNQIGIFLHKAKADAFIQNSNFHSKGTYAKKFRFSLTDVVNFSNMEMILLCLINVMHNKRVGVNISKILSGEFSARQAQSQREVVKIKNLDFFYWA